MERPNYGLQLFCINPDTYRIDHYTPRNVNVALAMAEWHSRTHRGYWLYKIQDYTPHSKFEPIVHDSWYFAEEYTN